MTQLTLFAPAPDSADLHPDRHSRCHVCGTTSPEPCRGVYTCPTCDRAIEAADAALGLPGDAFRVAYDELERLCGLGRRARRGGCRVHHGGGA